MTEAQQTWREPDADMIRRAMSRLGALQHRRVFYEKLENPLWVDALDREGVFNSPPEVVVNEDGTAHSAPWPEGGYLIRMASSVPGPVARILQRTCTSTNPYVRQLILRAAMALPPDHAAPFAKPLAQYLEEGSLAHAREVVDLAERLAESGHRKAAMRLLQSAFRPRAGKEAAGLGGKRTVRTGLERYWFEHGLPDAVRILVAVQPGKALTTAVSWLEAFMAASGEYVPDRLYDLSHIWRPSIAPHAQNQGSKELGDALIDAVRDLGIRDILGGRDVADVVEVFERNDQPLSQRIALHVLAVTSPDSDAARDVGLERLLMPALMDSDYRHEYASLARAILPLASEDQVEAWGGVFDAGPHLDDEKVGRGRRTLEVGRGDPRILHGALPGGLAAQTAERHRSRQPSASVRGRAGLFGRALWGNGPRGVPLVFNVVGRAHQSRHRRGSDVLWRGGPH